MKRTAKLVAVFGVLFAAHSLLHAWVPQVQSGQWAALQPDLNLPPVGLLQARDGAAAVLLQDDRVLIVGGSAPNGTPLNSVELFYTPNATFVSAMPMSVGRTGHTATLLEDGRVLVVGGTTVTGDATKSVEIYDPAGDTWTSAGDLVTARSGHTATLIKNDRVVITGGENTGTPVGTLEVYNVASGTVAAAGPLQSARKGHAAALLADGRVAIFGGSDGTAPLATTEIFDPATVVLTNGPSMPQPRAGVSAVSLLDGRVLIVGGNDGNVDLSSALVFDGTSYTPAGSLTLARQRPVLVLLPNNNHVLVTGGTLNSGAVATAELFRPWSNTFVPTGLPTSLRVAPATAPLKVDGVLMAAGGDGTGSTELYGFATVKTDKDDYAPGETVTITGSGWVPFETVTLTLLEVPYIDTHVLLPVIADANGIIVSTEFSPDPLDLNMRFYLTAQGSQSEAQNTFTDSRTITGVTLNGVPIGTSGGVTVASGAAITAVISVDTTGSNNNAFDWKSTGWRISTTGPGALPATITCDKHPRPHFRRQFF